MKETRVNLADDEEDIIKEFMILEDLASKEKAIKQLIKKSVNLIPELSDRIKTKKKYKQKQK